MSKTNKDMQIDIAHVASLLSEYAETKWNKAMEAVDKNNETRKNYYIKQYHDIHEAKDKMWELYKALDYAHCKASPIVEKECRHCITKDLCFGKECECDCHSE